LLSLLLITLILMFISPQTRLAVRTFALLPSFFASLPGSPIDLVTPAPRREVVDLAPVDGYVRAHIYRPAHGRNSALVISLGIDPAPPDDPRVVRLMDGLARSGIAAVLIESEALNQDQLFPDLPKALIEGVQFLQRQPYVRTDRVGLFGFSVGGSLALTAAADPAIAEQLRLVEAFGSYATLDDAILSIATRTLDDRGAVRPWQPLADARQHLASALIGGISDSGEAAALRARLVDGTGAEPDPEELSDEGRAIERLMTSRDRAHGRGAARRIAGSIQTRCPVVFSISFNRPYPRPAVHHVRCERPASALHGLSRSMYGGIECRFAVVLFAVCDLSARRSNAWRQPAGSWSRPGRALHARFRRSANAAIRMGNSFRSPVIRRNNERSAAAPLYFICCRCACNDGRGDGGGV